MDEYIRKLMREIDAEVEELVDAFRLLLTYQVLITGSGMEFSDLREYVPGYDDATKIDWKASLRSNKLYIKEYEEERDMGVFVLLDTSSSMLFGTQNRMKSEYAAVISGSLVHAALENGDDVGFALFNKDVLDSYPPTNESSRYFRILESAVDPRNYGNECNLKGALDHAINSLDKKTVVFIISDFIGLDEGWDDSLKMAAAKFDKVFGVMVRDIRDSRIEPGVGNIRLADPFSDKIITVDLDQKIEEYNKLAAEQERYIENTFRNSRCMLIKSHTTEPFIQSLVMSMELTEWW